MEKLTYNTIFTHIIFMTEITLRSIYGSQRGAGETTYTRNFRLSTSDSKKKKKKTCLRIFRFV